MPSSQHELLPIVVQENTQLVDARLLHQKLKSGRQYTDWIKFRIKEYGFKENEDFFASQKNEAKRGGHNRVDYLLTLDMAKELAMLERNETGRQIRRYFIAKEKELRAISHLPKEQALFKGLKPHRINNRLLYPYLEILQRSGYSTNSSSHRRQKYWMHFVKEGNKLLVTEEYALHLYHQRKVLNNRSAMLAAQPVLALEFYEKQGGAKC